MCVCVCVSSSNRILLMQGHNSFTISPIATFLYRYDLYQLNVVKICLSYAPYTPDLLCLTVLGQQKSPSDSARQ